METDNRLHNTRLLLRNYGRFKQHINNAVHSSDKISGIENEFIELEMMDRQETYINSILRTKERTQIIIEHIDRLLETYRQEAEDKADKEQEMRYKVIRGIYLVDYRQSVQQMAIKLNVSDRTVYRYRNEAIEELSVLFFGVDAIRIVS